MDNDIKQKGKGIIIITNRTPVHEALAELTRAFFAFLFQTDANEQVVVEFSIKKIDG